MPISDTVSSFRTIHSISEICMVLKNKVSLVLRYTHLQEFKNSLR
nr:MAG TPA: hypothetical protein [Caudoviricetes sp.]